MVPLKRRIRMRLLGAFLLAGASLVGGAVAAANLRVGDARVRTDRLVPGSHRYLRYRVNGGHRTAVDIWNRTISFETVKGQRLLHITQRWDEADPVKAGARALDQDSWFDAATFRPITHVRRVTKIDGSTAQAGYRFLPDRAVGMSELADNSRASFSLGYAELPFNFEYDMELLQTLPLGRGLDVNLPFYDAGVDAKADHYRFQVAGSAQIRGWNGSLVDCWLVTADYNTGIIKSRFWFEKKTHLLVREEQPLDDGAILVKTLLPPEAQDSAA
jgi:hypothetical protein